MEKEKNSKDKKSFFKSFKGELKKVSWPTPKQLVNNTAIVIGIVLLVAVIVFVLDVIFENLNNFGVERLKAIVTSSSEETTDVVDNSVETELVDEATEDTTSEVTDEGEAEQVVETEEETTTEEQ